MSAALPNHIRVSGERTFGSPFGEVCAVTPTAHVHGQGHTPHLQVRFIGGLCITLTPSTAAALLSLLPKALQGMPDWGGCSGACADLEGES